MSTPSRPLSPHLGIYRRQYTMVLSILHRATGLALSAGLILLTVWLLAVATGPDAYRRLAALAAGPLGLLVLAGFLISFCYHFVTGIRHFVFDTGRALERREARRSAVVVVVATLILVALALYVGLRARGLA